LKDGETKEVLSNAHDCVDKEEANLDAEGWQKYSRIIIYIANNLLLTSEKASTQYF